ncbi:MAG: hypothetical protein HUJ73_09105, partial [Eubacterium sp.]|nr:hypothetical protein [Eubacterium sp.]
MKKNIAKRVLAGILVVLMMIQFLPGDTIYADPSETSASSVVTQSDAASSESLTNGGSAGKSASSGTADSGNGAGVNADSSALLKNDGMPQADELSSDSAVNVESAENGTASGTVISENGDDVYADPSEPLKNGGVPQADEPDADSSEPLKDDAAPQANDVRTDSMTDGGSEEIDTEPEIISKEDIDAYAALSETPENSGTVFVPLINNESTENSAALSVSYLEPLTLSLRGFTPDDGVESSIVFFCRSAEDPNSEWTIFGDGPCTLEPGQYVLTYTYNDNDEYAVDGPEADFGFTVTKAEVSAPSNLHWDGSNPAWTAPVTTTDGGVLPGGVINTYTLIAYKNGAELDRFNAFSDGYPNFANHIVSTGFHEGVYTFRVEIGVTEAAQSYFTGCTSEDSPSFVVPLVKVRAGSGIAAVQPAEKLLIPGDPNGLAVKATVKTGYTFINWTGSSVQFADSTAAETTVFLSADYADGTELVVTANAGDISGPVITDFRGAGSGKLSAKTVDMEDGVAAYAFSTETSADQVVWTAVSPAVQEDTYEYALTSGGIYYFYAKDAAGNVSRSENTVQVTEVKYHDYYTEDGPKAYSDFIIGSDGVTVSVPVRPAYVFEGWFTDPEFTVPAETSYTDHSASPYELYAKWTAVTLPEITVSGLSRTYSGNDTKLRPVMDPVDGILSYAWFKNGTESGTGEQLAVKNVSDSGTYSLVVTLEDTEGNIVDTEEVENISVDITPADLTVQADNQTILYNMPAPEYTLTITGLLGSDTKDVITGTVSCDYTVGSSVGRYGIRLTDFHADNYDITTGNGILTVNAGEEDLTVAFKDGTPDYTYEENRTFEPEVAVTLGEQPLPSSDYVVSYSDNNKAGTAKAVVTSDYFAEKTLYFTIKKAKFEPEVVISDRKYDGTKAAPALSLDHPEGGSAVWYYAEKDAEDFGAVSPENAGDYTVYAVIEETDNYLGFETEKADFSILKRKITITANSQSFVYDGLPHSDDGYVVTGDGFVPGQNFYSVTVTGSVTMVTPEDQEPNNLVSYTLTSNTLPENYDIEAVPGILSVTKDTLPAPFNPHWNTAKPGEAVWVPVSKRGLTVSYHVELLAYDGTDYQKIDETDTSENACDFSAAIRSHAVSEAENGSVCSYFFTVKAVPSGGTNRDNYKESDKTEKTGEIFTAVLSYEGENVSEAGISGADTYVLLSNETVAFEAQAETGYEFSVPAFSLSNSQIQAISYSIEEDELTGSIKAALTESLTDVVLTFHTKDKAPVVEKAGFSSRSPYDQVQISFTGRDDLGLTGWVIKKGDTLPGEEDWNPIPETEDGQPSEITESFTVTEPGKYYAFFRDVVGNVSVSEECFTIYRYNFDPGAEDAEGSMDPVLKEESETIVLPEAGYERTGFSFKDWKGVSGIYEDGAKLSANPGTGFEETLTALWAGNEYAFTVKYFLMDLEGNYPSDPYKEKIFYAPYGAERSSDLDSLQLDLTGFTRDDDRKEEITIAGDGQTLAVYYSRNIYKLTFSYTLPGDETPAGSTVSKYYGADLSDAFGASSKPSVPGYNFVGWFFGDTGAQPASMPASDVMATGYFTNEIVNYHLNYYLQDLNEDGTAADTYALYADGSKTLTAIFGDELAMNSDLAELPDGFSYFGTLVTEEPFADADITLPEGVSSSAETTAASGKTINVFLNRNTYTATLNVWQGKVNKGDPVYTWSVDLLYGADFPEGLAEKNR